MSEANPITFAENLRTVLARYIATTLPISRRYPRLGREFRELLQREQLVQGPYVEALPDFAFVDTRASVGAPEDPDKLFESPDGLHPTSAGYRRMAEAIGPIVEKLLR